MAEIITRCNVFGLVQTNCYFITNKETNETIIIDPADNSEDIISLLLKDNLIPVGILLTHGHFDHIMAAFSLKQKYNIKIYSSEAERDLLENEELNCSYSFLRTSIKLTPDILLKDNQEFELAGLNIKAIHTPGHTKGSMCYYFINDKIIITGDTLFKESVGRCDLPTGCSSSIIESLQNKISILNDDIEVLPGHGEFTTIGHEKKYNPFFSRESYWD